jgi:hypothetical protein
LRGGLADQLLGGGELTPVPGHGPLGVAQCRGGDRLAAMEYGRYQGPEDLWPAIEQKGQLREGLTAEEAAVLTYAIAGPDTFRQLL